MQFSRDNLKLLRTRLDNLLSPLARELDIQLKVGSCSYNPEGTHASFKIEASTIDTSGTVMTKEAATFRQFARMLGLKPDDLGREFVYARTAYKLVGYAPRARRFPFLAVRLLDNKTFKLPEIEVLNALKTVA